MKKIMFSDRFGLTQAVIDRRKTKTRRIITHPSTFKGMEVRGFNVYRRTSDGAILEPPIMRDADECDIDKAYILPKYKVGEIVAVAQSYKDAGVKFIPHEDDEFGCIDLPTDNLPGYTNKMFVRADLMPHRIRITDRHIERLQDISNEDCIKEGVIEVDTTEYDWQGPTSQPSLEYQVRYRTKSGEKALLGATPREAYAALIDKISGKGTWESNPFVWVYEFELIK